MVLLNRSEMLERLLALQGEINRAYATIENLEAEQATLKAELIKEPEARAILVRADERSVTKHRDRKAYAHTLEFIRKVREKDPKRSALEADEIAQALGCTRGAALSRCRKLAQKYPDRFKYQPGEGGTIHFAAAILTATINKPEGLTH